jgi:glyceraldehyde-3-phosphate dehydrogenase (NADP+)
LAVNGNGLLQVHVITHTCTADEAHAGFRFARGHARGDDAAMLETVHVRRVPRDLLLLGAWQTGEADPATLREPWSGATLGEVAQASPAQASRAAAHAAELGRMRIPTYARRELLRRIVDGLRGDADRFATLIAREAGKPLRLARAEVLRATGTFELAAECLSQPIGEVFAADLFAAGAGYNATSVRVPRGPVLAITPFNFPLNLVAHKVAPALALGIPVVLKPAPQTPLTALALADLFQRAARDLQDIPAGLLQVLPGGVATAETLVQDTHFSVVSFTGSAEVGERIRRNAERKHVVLELGGSAAAIVHHDAPADAAARIAASAFGYAGQVCIKTQRVYVHASIVEAFIDALIRETGHLRQGDVLDEGTALGSVIDARAADRIRMWIGEAIAAGARPLGDFTQACGDHERGAHAPANIVPKTILDVRHVDASARHALRAEQEEIFGPVVTVASYDHFEEACAWVNANRYGLQAGVFTDSARLMDVAFERLEVGGVIFNDSASVRFDHLPYGGVKDSGLGREGVRYALDEYTQPKVRVTRRTPG